MDVRTRGRSLAFLQGAGDGAGEIGPHETHDGLKLTRAHRLKFKRALRACNIPPLRKAAVGLIQRGHTVLIQYRRGYNALRAERYCRAGPPRQG